MPKIPKIAIIGAGPAGIYCAIKILSEIDAKIDIYEKNSPLHTLLPTGNGRCNLSYNEFDNKILASNYPRGEKFLYSVFAKYSPFDTIKDFNDMGIKTYIQDDGRIFPIKNSAKFVRDTLLSKLKNKVNFIKKEVNEKLTGYDAVILSVGLKNYPKIMQSYGHTIIDIKPSLVGLKIKEKEFSELEGVSFNDVIFTKNGVSGPFIYKLSSYMAYKDFPYKIKIPLICTDKLTEYVKLNPKKQFKNALSNFIPKSLAGVLIKSDVNCANTKKVDIEKLEYLNLTATGYDNNGEIVHAGGVKLNEIDNNFKSKIYPNLWIIGELLDVDGLCGGFNLQFCWSSAAICAKNIVQQLRG